MYSATHLTAGLTLATIIPQPAIALAAGLASHYLLDAIPHGDTADVSFWKSPSNGALTLGLDGIGAIAVIALFFGILHQPTDALIAGAVGSVLPDAAWGARALFNFLHWRLPLVTRLLDWHYRVHQSGHVRPQSDVSFRAGLIMQLLAIVLIFSLLTKVT